MKVLAIMALLIFPFDLAAQVIRVRQRTISELQSQEAKVSSKFYSLMNRGSQQRIVVKNTTVDFSQHQSIVLNNSNFLFITKPDKLNEKYLIKIDQNGREVNTLNISGSEISPLSNGNFLTVDFSHGFGSDYVFISEDLVPIKVFQPQLNNGFKYTNYGSSLKLVCIYSQETEKSPEFRLSLLDLDGNLVRSKDFARSVFLASDVQVGAQNIFVVLNSTTSGSSKVLCLDFSLNIVWQKDLDRRLVNQKVTLSPNGESVLLITQEMVGNFGCKQGNRLWSRKPQDIFSNPVSLSDTEFVFEGNSIAIVARNSQGNKVNAKLAIINGKTGENEGIADVTGTDDPIEIQDEKERFYLIKKSGIDEISK